MCHGYLVYNYSSKLELKSFEESFVGQLTGFKVEGNVRLVQPCFELPIAFGYFSSNLVSSLWTYILHFLLTLFVDAYVVSYILAFNFRVISVDETQHVVQDRKVGTRLLTPSHLVSVTKLQ